MTDSSIVTVAGPSGVGKTAWIVQRLKEARQPAIYVSAGRQAISTELATDLAYVGYRFPQVRVANERELPQLMGSLSKPTVVYVELDCSHNLQALIQKSLPGRRVAILPPSMNCSRWHKWASEVIPGNEVAILDSAKTPEWWTMSLSGQVFDANSLDDIALELTGGAYGKVHRMKGLFELPNGHSFHLDFVKGLDGIEYSKLNIPRWLDGRPQRFSGIEVVGWNLEQDTITQTVRDGCLSDEAIAHYQHQYKSLVPQAAS